MKVSKAGLLAVVAVAVMAAIVPAQSGALTPEFRFLWPADPGAPGQDLVEAQKTGSDAAKVKTPLGRAEATITRWSAGGSEVLESRVYALPGREDALVIETEVLQEIAAPTGDYYTPHFAAPAMKVPAGMDRVLTYKVDAFSPPSSRAVATTGPVVLYSDDLEVMVLSPLDNFMEAMQAPVDGEWRFGFGGMIRKVPAGTVHRVLAVSGKGIRRTLMTWGDLIRSWHGRERAGLYQDVGVGHLGYYTDNGAYYYYKDAPGMNYHQTLMAVKNDADQRGIPFGYFQIDSWWYPKAKSEGLMGAARGGSLVWEPIPEMFPEGLAVFQEELGLPLVAHNRWYDQDSPYCERYECVYGHGDKTPALPIEPAFWDEIMDNAVSYGVEVYEQDWLITQMNLIPWLREDFGNASSWFDTMVNKADEHGLTMQLCMASPEFFLQQLKHDNVTHVRASGDYQGGLVKDFFWPNFHTTSMFAWAVGLMPFKDNFQSSARQRTVRNERWAFEEALISNLSAGPVGPGDKIGAADKYLLMQTCRKDGLLLKPDRPAMPIDLMFLDHHKPWIVTTESKHEIGTTYYLAAFNTRALSTFDKSITLDDAGISGEYFVYDYRGHQELGIIDSIDFNRFGVMAKNEGKYYVIAPVLDNGMAVVGELDKFVTMSRTRFPEIKLVGKTLSVKIEGVPGEEVVVGVYMPREPVKVTGVMEEEGPDCGCEISMEKRVFAFPVLIPASGKATLTVE